MDRNIKTTDTKIRLFFEFRGFIIPIKIMMIINLCCIRKFNLLILVLKCWIILFGFINLQLIRLLNLIIVLKWSQYSMFLLRRVSYLIFLKKGRQGIWKWIHRFIFFINWRWIISIKLIIEHNLIMLILDLDLCLIITKLLKQIKLLLLSQILC